LLEFGRTYWEIGETACVCPRLCSYFVLERGQDSIRRAEEPIDKAGAVRIDQINEAYDRMERGDVKFRFVIDMASMPAASTS
jgi:hypothetical protein